MLSKVFLPSIRQISGLNQCWSPLKLLREYRNFQLAYTAEIDRFLRAKGNMLLEIDGVNPNPTQVLINAIQQRGGTGLTKEEEFYLGFLDNGVSFLKSEKNSVFPDYLQDIKRVIKILSGDPSRGAMSLDMEDSIIAGQVVQVSKENHVT